MTTWNYAAALAVVGTDAPRLVADALLSRTETERPLRVPLIHPDGSPSRMISTHWRWRSLCLDDLAAESGVDRAFVGDALRILCDTRLDHDEGSWTPFVLWALPYDNARPGAVVEVEVSRTLAHVPGVSVPPGWPSAEVLEARAAEIAGRAPATPETEALAAEIAGHIVGAAIAADASRN